MQNEERGIASPPSEPEKTIATKWESATGLDDMMNSLSGKDDEVLSAAANALQTPTPVPQTVFFFGDEESNSSKSAATSTSTAPTQSPKPEPAVAVPTPAVTVPIGTLSVAAITNTDDKDPFGDSAFDNCATIKVIPKSTFAKKGVPAKKSSVSRIMTSTPGDVRLESFESVEKRSTLAVQEAADHKVALQLQEMENNNGSGGGGSARLSAIYQESESIYRTPATASTSSSIYSSNSSTSPYRSNGGNGSSKSSTFNVAASSESYQARNKYSGNKGISSDQFFGRDEEDMEIMKNRLSKMSTANAIGSDMLSNDDAANEYQSGGNRRPIPPSDWDTSVTRGRALAAGSAANLEMFKDSVSNMIGDLQKRLG